ncbi:MAG: alpha-amylase [Desulfobacteraceae bacterium]|nr:MAG: alpha-amylase [Desulfobacteraceae bacterium]
MSVSLSCPVSVMTNFLYLSPNSLNGKPVVQVQRISVSIGVQKPGLISYNQTMSKGFTLWLAPLLFWSLLQFPCFANAHSNRAVKPGAVIYGVVPPFFGEGLRDVTANLDRLQELGVDILWLSPINATDDPSDISYAVTDHFAIRSDFGTIEELRELVKEAHARGLKVIMDFVPNHTSSGHPYFLDIRSRGKASRFYDYYDRDELGRITHYFHWETLPNLNYENPGVASMMECAFRYWVVEAGIDGFRVDAAWGVRERASAFWGRLVKELRGRNPQIIMLAEAGARDSYFVANGFDLAYDWTEKIGEWAWKAAFDSPHEAGKILHEAVTNHQDAHHTVRFLNNNDTGIRFISRYGQAFTRAAAVVQHTVPGVPILYTGDEVGAEYDPYEDPGPISWQDKHGLRDLYRNLADLRERLPAIHSGHFVPLPLPENPAVYAFLRYCDHGNWALVIVNFGSHSSVQLTLPQDLAPTFPVPVQDALTGKAAEIQVEGPATLKMNLPPMEALILIPSAD